MLNQTVISGSSIVVQSREQVASDLGGEVVILNLASGQYYGLNPVGTRIWELIQEPRSVDNVRDAILAEYEVEPECCERDLLALLEGLAAEGLIEIKSAALV
jgi:Coenzyme PQQ synthesis protein D (PqqD)